MLRTRFSDLARMSPEDQSAVLVAVARRASAPVSGARVVLDSRIRDYEIRYEMTSAELRARLAAGGQRETTEIADWLFLLDARDNRVRS
jgi:hypothetical protein